MRLVLTGTSKGSSVEGHTGYYGTECMSARLGFELNFSRSTYQQRRSRYRLAGRVRDHPKPVCVVYDCPSVK